jgi:hypothetical protein
MRFWASLTPRARPQRANVPPTEMQIPVWPLVISERRIVIRVPLMRTFGLVMLRRRRPESTTSCAVREK